VTFTAAQISAAGGAISVAPGATGEHAISVSGAGSVSLTALTGITSLTVATGVEVVLSDQAVTDLVATVDADAGFTTGLSLATGAVVSVSAASKTALTSGTTPVIAVADLVYAIKDTAANILAEFGTDSTYISGATSVTVTDAISIADFNTIDAQTGSNIVLSGGISDTAANLAPSGAEAAGFTAATTQDPDVSVTITGTNPTVAELNAISSATTGVVTATISDNIATLVTLTTAVTDAVTMTVTDTTAAAADLNTVDAITSVAIDATAVATITGTATAIVTAAQSAGITTAADYAATVNSGTASVAQALILDADTRGAITATITEGDLATLVTLTDANGNNALTISVTDTSADATDLIAVDAITSVAVDARTVETITGTVEELVSYREAFTAKTITGLSLYTAVTEDTAASAAELLALADPSTGFNPDVDLTSIETIDGSASNIELLYALQNDDASVSNLGDEAIDLTDAGSIAATVLTDVAALTSGLVTSASVTTITGAASEVKAALESAQLTSLDAVNVTISDVDGTEVAATTLSVIRMRRLRPIDFRAAFRRFVVGAHAHELTEESRTRSL
jgi:hypothetical protein